MERIAVFVDAGYFYARCSELLIGANLSRRSIELDEAQLVDELIAFAESKAGGPNTLLRIYWYDGAAVTGLSPEQIRMAEVDNVKLRLGVINTYGQQKGVDSLIVIDLIDLARNHAISSAVLLSGDEDIRIAVTVAQTYGVRVHLLGIGNGEGSAQSRALIREADTKTTWDAQALHAFVKVREDRPLLLPWIAAAPAAGRVATEGEFEEAANVEEDSPASYAIIEASVAAFLTSLTSSDRDDILLVFDRDTRFPIYHDRRLLASVGRSINRPLTNSERHRMRGAAIELLRASASTGPLGDPASN